MGKYVIDHRIEVPRLSLEQCMRDYPFLMAALFKELPTAVVPPWQIANVVSIVMGLCHECWEQAAGCPCSNDE
jgi:hypothetical protein